MRKFMTMCIVFLVMLIAALIVYIISILDSSEGEEATPSSTAEPSSIVFETVAHIPEGSFPDYTLVWSDIETDRAVYIKNDYTPTVIVAEGDIVTFNDIICTVSSTDEQGFELMLPADTLAAYGMSGSVVTFNGVPIAMVSKATSVNSVYAVYY